MVKLVILTLTTLVILVVGQGGTGKDAKKGCSTFDVAPLNKEWYEKLVNNPEKEFAVKILYQSTLKATDITPSPKPKDTKVKPKLLSGSKGPSPKKICSSADVSSPILKVIPGETTPAPLKCDYKDPETMYCDLQTKDLALAGALIEFGGIFNITKTDNKTYVLYTGCLNQKIDYFFLASFEENPEVKLTDELKQEIQTHLKAIKFDEKKFPENGGDSHFTIDTITFDNCKKKKGPLSSIKTPKKIKEVLDKVPGRDKIPEELPETPVGNDPASGVGTGED